MNQPSPERSGAFAEVARPSAPEVVPTSVISEGSIFRNTEDVAWRDVDGDMVVLDLNSGAYLTFNGLGRRVWLAAVAGKKLGVIVDEVVQEYQVERDRALTDVREFLTSLLDQRALILANA